MQEAHRLNLDVPRMMDFLRQHILWAAAAGEGAHLLLMPGPQHRRTPYRRPNWIPNFRMRDLRVFGLIPMISAAPPGP